MASKHKSNGQIVRYQKGKTRFEILTKKGAASKYRQKKVGLQHVLMIDQIFSKLSQGKVAKNSDLQRVFGTSNLNECVIQILESGTLNLSSAERATKSDAKRNGIAYYIAKNYINPRTNTPHPRDRILQCMSECKVRIDATKSIRTQSLSAIKKMSGKLCFAKSRMLSVRLTVRYKYDLNKVGVTLSRISGGASCSQKWSDEGCSFALEMNRGDIEELQKALSSMTNGGDYQLVVEEQHSVTPGRVAGATQASTKGDLYRMDVKDVRKMNRKKKKRKRI